MGPRQIFQWPFRYKAVASSGGFKCYIPDLDKRKIDDFCVAGLGSTETTANSNVTCWHA